MSDTTTTKRQYDFLSRRKMFAIISAIAVSASLLLVLTPGPKYGIDFAGGTNVIARFDETVEAAEVRQAVFDAGFSDAGVVRFGGFDANQFLIETQAIASLTPDRLDAFRAALLAGAGDGAELDIDESAGDRAYLRVSEAEYEGASSEGEGADLAQARAEALTSLLLAELARADFDGATVESYGNPNERRFVVRTEALQKQFENELLATFGERFLGIDRVETVGPRVGQQLREDGVKAVLLALIAILVYIAFRFDLRYAPGAVAALFHDVTITLGIFVIFQIEISLPIIAALLTIVGYSLNDTIVNFDRVRENLDLQAGRFDLVALVNRSINECLSRTILTSVTTLIAVTMILIFGGGLIRSFAIAMAIGIVIGTYSSIFIANPLMIWMSQYLEARKEAKQAATA
jgi:preprotein translocase subunit SecF